MDLPHVLLEKDILTQIILLEKLVAAQKYHGILGGELGGRIPSGGKKVAKLHQIYQL